LIASGRGSFSGAKGRLTIYLHPRGSGKARSVRVVIQGHCRAAAQGCTQLDGELSGRLSSSRGGPPDTGREYLLTGTGRIGPLGQVTVRGEVAGAGFIAHGHELMKMTLSSSSGGVTVEARSGPVKGFTKP
jgi:hypothetical protein